MQHLSRLQERAGLWRGLDGNIASLIELTELAIAEGDSSLEDQLRAEVEELHNSLERERLRLTLSGAYDDRTAIVSIHAGAGGIDSQDWVSMLLRMYIRWSESDGRAAQVLDISPGEEEGVKSATMEVGGQYAYGYLKSERGVHRLVRLSPFDANHLRHTSFALVEVLPAGDEDPELAIRPDDLKVEFYGSSGPGGQNVQKVSSAVRLTHLPTGTVVTCQNERSQYQNREFAMKILTARLLEIKMAEKAEEMARLKGDHVSAEWGNQIRSYVLHPYRMVKDHRTGYETSDADKVLDGDLDEVLREYLMWTVGRDKKARDFDPERRAPC